VRRTISAPVRVTAGTLTRRLGRLNAYRFAYASWYGPGLYGNRLGCGGTLAPSRLGVAHKTLPCGSRVTLRHRGRTVRVRVIDRGPYVGGREYDLTAATARKLRFRGHGAILTTK
jgi:peptidoglycan lytic transglycosylase